MPRRVLNSGYQAMWLFALFDLPVLTKRERRDYTIFRKTLIKHGFSMLQYSVYARYCPDETAAEAYKTQVRANLPPEGQVRLLMVTERQFGKQEVYSSQKPRRTETAPLQLMLF